MEKRHWLLTHFYDKLLLDRPRIILICLLAIVAFLGYKAKDFKLEASTQTLILEMDVESRYGGHDYLLLTYAPKNDLFSDETLATLKRLRNELKQLKNVSSVISILDAPLLESPPAPVSKLAANIQTLESTTVDKQLAKTEFKKSPLYQSLLVSPDLKTTALQVTFHTDKDYQNLLKRCNLLKGKKANKTLTAAETVELQTVT